MMENGMQEIGVKDLLRNFEEELKNDKKEKENGNEKKVEKKIKEEEEVNEVKPKYEKFNLKTISLSNWMKKYASSLQNYLKLVSIQVNGVNANELILFSVPDKTDNIKRHLRLINDAHLIKVVDVKGNKFKYFITTNSFVIYIMIDETTLIKLYRNKRSTTIVSCKIKNGICLPFRVDEYSNKNIKDFLSYYTVDDEFLNKKLKLLNDNHLEVLMVKYNILSKMENIDTVHKAIKFLVDKQFQSDDVHHHLMIDNLLSEVIFSFNKK